MSIPVDPYLKLLRTQLGTLAARDGGGANDVIKYSHRILTYLLLQSDTLPTLQQKAVSEFADLLDELLAELQQIDGGMILSPWLMRHIRTEPDYLAAEPLMQNAVRLLTSQPTPNGTKLLQRINAITLTLEQSFKEAVLRDELKPAVGETAAEPMSDVQKQAFQAFLRNTFPAEATLEVGDARLVIGGGSKLTLFVTLRNTNLMPKLVVVRLDRPDGVGAKSVVNEFGLLQTLYQAGLAVPEPFALGKDTAVLGAPFIVTSLMEGHTIGDWTDVAEPSRAFALGLARNLAKLHRIPPEKVGDQVPGAKTTTRERVQQNIAQFENSWRTLGQPSVALELGYAWLKNHMEFAEGRRAIIHCELGTPNMLGKDGELTALLDWEEAAIGNPAQDLTYVRSMVMQMMPWEDFLAEYEKAGGEIPSEGEMDFYRLWRDVFGLHFLLMARTFFFSEMSSSMVLGYVAQHVYRRYLLDLHESVKLLYERY